MIVDSHCHLHLIDYKKLDTSMDQVIKNCDEKKVTKLLNVATNLEDLEEISSIHNDYPNVYSSIGVHPSEELVNEPSIDDYIKLSASSEKIIAIGETGLDYYHASHPKELQINRFINQINAAKSTNKPIIVHTRAAKKDTINILSDSSLRVSGVIHCFTEDKEMAKKCLDLGFYISISGIVTFKNALDLQEVAKYVPLDRMLVETDSPYLAPVPFRGKINQPCNVVKVAEFIAKLKNTDYELVAAKTTENFENLFFSKSN